MSEQEANLRGPANGRDRESQSRAIKALFTDLYNYFRMDSSMNPMILFEQLCYVLIQLQAAEEVQGFDKPEDDPTARYFVLMNQCKRWNDQPLADLFVFSHKPELVRRLLDTADKARKLAQDKKQLVAPLFDFLEDILQARKGETVRTPLPIAREIVNLTFRKNQMTFFTEILDPACGSGAFLLAVLERIETDRAFPFNHVEGLEQDEHLRHCVMLMARFYGPIESTVTVADGGSPVQIAENTYDLILTNPPFRTQSLRDREIIGDFSRLPIFTKDIHRAFLQRTLLGLKAGGQSAIIVPDSFLSHTGSDAIRVRSWIVEEFQCMGIVKLPAYAFYPPVSVNASILFIRKPQSIEKQRRSRKGVFFFAVQIDGHSNDTRRQPENQNDFVELQQVWNMRDALWDEWTDGARTQNVHGMDVPRRWNHPHFWFGRLEDIRSSDYSLLPAQYQPLSLLGESTRKPGEILKEIQQLGGEIMELTQKLMEAEHDR